MTAEVNSEQAKWWNAAGEGWANAQDIVDLVLRPFEELLVRKAAERPRDGVLDVGCGTGAVTRAIADATKAACVGVDISETMIAGAERRANVRFVVADAQVHSFEESFDLVVSRFGVMFFDDPVAAFRNLLRATTPGGELCFITWRSAEENPFMTTAQQAAAPLLPDMPAPDPNGPGPFSLTDADRTRELFKDAGWSGIDIQPVDRICTMPEQLLVPYLDQPRTDRASPEGSRGVRTAAADRRAPGRVRPVRARRRGADPRRLLADHRASAVTVGLCPVFRRADGCIVVPC